MAIYSGFSHWKWWFSIAMWLFTRGYPHWLGRKLLTPKDRARDAFPGLWGNYGAQGIIRKLVSSTPPKRFNKIIDIIYYVYNMYTYIYIYHYPLGIPPSAVAKRPLFWATPVFQAWPRNETELVEAAHATARGSSSVEVQVSRSPSGRSNSGFIMDIHVVNGCI